MNVAMDMGTAALRSGNETVVGDGDMDMDAMLEMRQVTKRYENFTLDHVDFVVPKGYVTGLIGENGAGKTTLMKAALGLIRTEEGEILLDGKPLAANDRAVKERFGVVFDSSSFPEELSAKQIGRILQDIYSRWEPDTFAQLLHRFSIPTDKKVKEYSRGMKMKLSIAASLSHHADFLLLDEATGGLDPVVREEILELFQEFMEEEGHTILMSSHITSDLEKIADYVAFMKDGRMVFQEEKDVLLSSCGILKCGRDDFRDMDCPAFLASREHVFGREILLRDRHSFEVQYPEAVVDPVKLEDIMLFLVKGEQL